MNKRVIIRAIRAYRKAFEYEQKMYKVINMIAINTGDTMYIDEMGDIQHETEQIIAEESGFNDILNLEDYDTYMRDIVEMIKDGKSEESILAKIVEIRKYNM